jgi:hypothetical protein
VSRYSRWSPPPIQSAEGKDRCVKFARIQIALRAQFLHDLRGYADFTACDALAFFTLTEEGRLICDGYPGPGAAIPNHLRPLLARRYAEDLTRLPDGSAERAS